MLKPICVRLPNWVGDACMTLPALQLLRAAGHRYVLVGKPWARDLLAGLEPAHFIALQGSLSENRRELRQQLQQLASRAPIAPPGRWRGVTFPDSFSSALLFRLAGVQAAGFRDDGRSLLLRWPIQKPRRPLHVVESYFYLVRTALQRWGHNHDLPLAPAPSLDLPLLPAHEQAAQSVRRQAGLDEKRFVLISPTATGLHQGRIKTWSHYDELATSLKAEGWPVVMCPPPQEIDVAKAAAPHAQVLPSLPLGAYAALARQSALVICNDSGSSHVAAAAGAPLLTLFGVTNPERTRPWSPTASCLGREGQWPSLEEVLSAARQQLHEPAAH